MRPIDLIKIFNKVCYRNSRVYRYLLDVVGRQLLEKRLAQYACGLGVKVIFSGPNIELIKNSNKVILHRKHRVYAHKVVTLFDDFINVIIPEDIGSFKVADFSLPRCHTLRKGRLKFYFSSIPEIEMQVDGYFHAYRPKEGDTVFDAGAYCGFTTYHLSRMVGSSGKVYAFEPDETNYEMLLNNIRGNNLNNVTPIRKCLWGRNMIIPFNSEAAPGSGSVSRVKRGKAVKISWIDALSLEGAYRYLGLKKVDFIKMDIEGAEIDAIEGCKDFIRDNDINFAIAAYHIVDGRESYLKLQDIFKGLGYKTKVTCPEHLTLCAYK